MQTAEPTFELDSRTRKRILGDPDFAGDLGCLDLEPLAERSDVLRSLVHDWRFHEVQGCDVRWR